MIRATFGGIAGIVAAVQPCVLVDPVGGIAVRLAAKSDLIIVSDPRIRCGKIRRGGRQEPPARTRRIVQVFHRAADIVVLIPRTAVARCAGPDPLIIGAVDVRVVHIRVRVLIRAGEADDCAVAARPGRRGEAEERQRQAAPRGGCWFHRVAVGPLRCPKPQNPIKTLENSYKFLNIIEKALESYNR